jgi:phosphonatase-like hydrolase
LAAIALAVNLPEIDSMQYQLVIFDLAGTTVRDNKDVHRILQSALLKQGVVITIEDANEVMGIPKPEAIRILLEKRRDNLRLITDQWIGEIHGDFVADMIRFYETDASVGEKAGVTETFRKLKSLGIKIAVNTGFDRAITEALLTRLGWQRDLLIDYSVTSDEVIRGRPFPDMIFHAMKRLGVDESSRVIKVGDTVSDLQEGHAAGCGIVVGITSGAFSAQALEKESPHHLINEIPELLTLLK